MVNDLNIDWRERMGDAENIQLEKIYDFLSHQPKLTNRLSPEFVDLDHLLMEEQTKIIQGAKRLQLEAKNKDGIYF